MRSRCDQFAIKPPQPVPSQSPCKREKPVSTKFVSGSRSLAALFVLGLAVAACSSGGATTSTKSGKPGLWLERVVSRRERRRRRRRARQRFGAWILRPNLVVHRGRWRSVCLDRRRRAVRHVGH